MTHSRRKVLTHGLGATFLTSGLILPQQAFADGQAKSWASQPLAGDVLSGNNINSAIAELNNHRSLISLANDTTLREECEMVATAAAQGIGHAANLRDNYSGVLSDAKITEAISWISAIVGTVGLIAFAFTTSPAWIVVSLGVGTASAAWSLVQFANSSGTSRAAMGVSHFGGRFSLVGATDAAPAAAKTVGRCLSGLAALADIYSAVEARIAISDVSDRLDTVTNSLTETRQRYIAFTSDLAACRAARLAEIDESISALTFVKDLGSVSIGPGPIILE